jgi:hypothetical protein
MEFRTENLRRPSSLMTMPESSRILGQVLDSSEGTVIRGREFGRLAPLEIQSIDSYHILDQELCSAVEGWLGQFLSIAP